MDDKDLLIEKYHLKHENHAWYSETENAHKHLIFKDFPTDSHTNWQWFPMIKASNPSILDKTDKNYRPVVQVIDNIERNHKLGLIYEYKVGKGKILVCMSPLNQLQQYPEARQLYKSILHYMQSTDFLPQR